MRVPTPLLYLATPLAAGVAAFFAYLAGTHASASSPAMAAAGDRGVDTSSVVAWAALITALVGTLAVPVIQAHFEDRRGAKSRMDERRYVAYTDAITYAQVIEARLDELAEDPDFRTNRKGPQPPDEVLIRAKLVLVAPARVTSTFDALVEAWDILIWNVSQDGPTGRDGEFQVAADGKDAIRVRHDLLALKSALRPKSLGKLDRAGGDATA